MTDWPMVELGNAAELQGGATPRRDNAEFWGGDIPWVTPTDLPALGAGITNVEYSEDTITREGLASCATRILPPSTVLFSSQASIGKIGIAAVPLATNQGFINLIPYHGLDSRYLAWCLHFYADRIADLAGSTTFKEVAKSALKRFCIPIPPIVEQRRIVEILDQADRLRRLRTEADMKAGRILPALFLRMFGDPATNPMRWPKWSLGSQATIVTGNTPSTKNPEYFGSDLPWVRPGDLDCALLVMDTERKLSHRGRRVARVVPAGSVLVVCIGATLGKVGLTGTEMATNQQINAILPSSTLLPEFLFAQCALLTGRFRAAATKSTLPILNKSRFAEQRVLVPPVDIQAKLVQVVKSVVSIGHSRSASGEHLGSLFDGVLDRAFKGSLTASWREGNMKELVQEIKCPERMPVDAAP